MDLLSHLSHWGRWLEDRAQDDFNSKDGFLLSALEAEGLGSGCERGWALVWALFLACSRGGLTPSSSADGGTDLLHERRPPNLITSRGPHVPKLSYRDSNP